MSKVEIMENKDLEIRTIALNDYKTFDTICNGFTFGVFQLESSLGRQYSKKVAPRSVEEIADLISIIRPGARDTGMADQYVAVKRGEEEASYIHEDLKSIL